MCDRIRETIFEDPLYKTDIAISQFERIQEALESLPVEEVDPEAISVLRILTATITLRHAFVTWKESGEDTPITREPLEIALRAAEAAHDTYTPNTYVYRRVCRRLGRAEVPLSAAEPIG